MRIRTFLLATVAAGCLAFGAHATEVDAKGAEALQKSILSYLPEKAAATGFVEVTPEKDHYRFAVDFGKLVHAYVPAKEFDLSLVYDGLIFPPSSDGLYPVRRDASDAAFSAKWEKGAEKGSVRYLLNGLAFDGMYDPALLYFRNFTASGSGGTISSDGGPQKIDASFGPHEQQLTSKSNADGSLDASTTGKLAGLRESVSDDKGMSATFSIETVDFKADLSAIKVQQIAEIVKLLASKVNQEKLEVADKQQLAGLVAGAMPLFGSMDESLAATNVAVEAQGIRVKIGKLDYSIGMDGLKDGSQFRFGFGVSDPDVSGIPQMMLYGSLVPQSVKLSMAIPGLNFGAPINAFLEQADFTKAEPLTKEQSEAIGKLFLKDGRLNVDVPEFSAKSALYDISATGTVSTEVGTEPTKATATFDVTARDLDKTIKGIQELGQKVPELNTASFGLMMAKGLAKNEADGTAHWKVEMDDAGVVKVNGQVMPH